VKKEKGKEGEIESRKKETGGRTREEMDISAIRRKKTRRADVGAAAEAIWRKQGF